MSEGTAEPSRCPRSRFGFFGKGAGVDSQSLLDGGALSCANPVNRSYGNCFVSRVGQKIDAFSIAMKFSLPRVNNSPQAANWHGRATWGMTIGLIISLALLLLLRPGVLGGLTGTLEYDTLDFWFRLRGRASVGSGRGRCGR